MILIDTIPIGPRNIIMLSYANVKCLDPNFIESNSGVHEQV